MIMREEFEAWAIGLGLTLHAGNGRYRPEIQCAWMAWRASRAAVVIALPSSRGSFAWDVCLEDCKEAIKAAGFKVKA